MRVLLVDDDVDSRAIYGAALAASGHEVLEAEDGREGVRLAEIWGPDVILMDLQIPLLDGWEATRRLKSDEATRAIPVIAVTARGLPEEERRAREAGCTGYLIKPVDPRDVVAEIGRLEEPR